MLLLCSGGSLAPYLAALFLPEDGRWRVSCGAALEGDAPPLGGNLVSGLCGNLRRYWRRKKRRDHTLKNVLLHESVSISCCPLCNQHLVLIKVLIVVQFFSKCTQRLSVLICIDETLISS